MMGYQNPLGWDPISPGTSRHGCEDDVVFFFKVGYGKIGGFYPPKSSILIGFGPLFPPSILGGFPTIFGNTHMDSIPGRVIPKTSYIRDMNQCQPLWEASFFGKKDS